MTIAPGKNALTINYDDLMNTYKSKDEELFKKNQWMFEGKANFLNKKQSLDGNKVAFISFPRSGNSFLRKYLESLTGIITGSDCPMTFSTGLLIAGLAGEQVIDDSVWVIKSHNPWNIINSVKFTCNKSI